MTLTYKLSKTAERDLEQLYRYTILQFGITQATDYLTEIAQTFELLARFPAMGKSAEWIRPNLRCHSHQSHMIYYRQRANDIFIVRVIHQRMDHKNLM